MPGTVALQMPEGLKIHAQRSPASWRRITGATFLIIGDPCYGACDYTVRYHAAMPTPWFSSATPRSLDGS